MRVRIIHAPAAYSAKLSPGLTDRSIPDKSKPHGPAGRTSTDADSGVGVAGLASAAPVRGKEKTAMATQRAAAARRTRSLVGSRCVIVRPFAVSAGNGFRAGAYRNG